MKISRLTKLLLIHCGWIELAQMDISLAICHRDDRARYQKRLAICRETVGYAKKAFAMWQAKAFC